MLLKSIDIQGFKTFPDKTNLKFNEKMVAVVGPNGSGKSNVSDAIRWVLGEQSTRVLRCSKMEDVIFKGTTSRKALGFAEVTMNIDNSDRSLNFDNDNLAITRRYYRSGESEYLINKATVRLRDINEMFMDTGLGRDGYSIIGQGKIDSIVSAKSEERREIFEEASGISKYRYRKEESERRLFRAEENLVRLRDILQELESRVEPLRIQSEKAKKFLEYDNEKRGLEIGIWVQNLSQFEKVLREQSEKTQLILVQYNSIEDKLDLINRENEKNHFKNAEINMKIDEERNNLQFLEESVLKSQSQVAVLENDILHIEQDIRRITAEITDFFNSKKDFEFKIAEINSKLKVLDESSDEANKEYIELSYKIEDMRKISDSVRKSLDDLLKENIELNSKLSDFKIESSTLKSSLVEIDSRSKNLEDSIAQSKDLSLKISQDIEKTINFENEIDAKIKEKRNVVQAYNLKQDNFKSKLDSLKNSIDALKLDALEQSRRAKILEDLERNFEGFTNSVKLVMKEYERGLLFGIHGPVTKLIHTPEQYAVAIETALGASMQNIVVDSEKDAKSAINFLKKRSGGRVTFLPLSTIWGKNVENLDFKKLIGFVGIASDLVSCESKYEGIKKSLLGRTIIAQDLDSAVLIAKNQNYRYRVVSLDGQVVNAGGSLTGGSQGRNSGLISRSAEIEKLKRLSEENFKNVEEKNQEYSALLAEFNRVTALQDIEKLEISRLAEDKVRISTEINAWKREFDNLANQINQLTKEKENSDLRTQSYCEKIEKLSENIEKLQLEISQNEKNQTEVLQNRNSSEFELSDINFKLQEIKIRRIEIQKNKEIETSNLNSLNERKNNSQQNIQKLSEQKKELENKIEFLNENINDVKLGTENHKQSILALKEIIVDLSKAREEIEIQNSKLREEERTFLSNKENVSKELARLQERMDNLQKDYDNIIKKLWEEYELTRKEASEQCIEIDDLQKANLRLAELKSKIRTLGSINTASIEEYAEVSERYEFLKVQVEDVEKSKDELHKLISELTHSMKDQFALRFSEIARNFTEIFKDLFGGGNASLTFSDDSDILNSGIEIKVHPPGKIVSHIEALSGGEKALVAISIYFAIMKVNPPPFCMLDEVEAALDDVNVRRFAEYLQRMNDNTQFIVITHRRGTMEVADILYGVTMQDDGISKLLALKSEDVESKLGTGTAI